MSTEVKITFPPDVRKYLYELLADLGKDHWRLQNYRYQPCNIGNGQLEADENSLMELCHALATLLGADKEEGTQIVGTTNNQVEGGKMKPKENTNTCSKFIELLENIRLVRMDERAVIDSNIRDLKQSIEDLTEQKSQIGEEFSVLGGLIEYLKVGAPKTEETEEPDSGTKDTIWVVICKNWGFRGPGIFRSLITFDTKIAARKYIESIEESDYYPIEIPLSWTE